MENIKLNYKYTIILI